MQRLQTYQEDEQKLINFVKELSNYKEQLTIKDPVSVQGKAVFNSTPVTVTFKPATINHGIAFYKDGLRVDASIDNVVSTDMYITLGSKTPLNIEYLLSNVSNNLFMKAIDFSLKISHKLLGFYDPHQINIVEHILATIYGLGIDNLEIHLNNNQLPIFNDGSLEYIKEPSLNMGN